ncbi:MAG: primosomal protein N' [Bacteroidia bacterium]
MDVKTYFVDVILPLSVSKTYTYRVPAIHNNEIEIGKRVLVQFGKKRIYTAIILNIHQTAPENYQAKYLEAVLDDFPIVSQIQLTFWQWLAGYYFSTIGDVMNAALPSGLKLSSASFVSLNDSVSLEEFSYDSFTEQEHQILSVLQNSDGIDIDSLSKKIGMTSIQKEINKLVKKGIIELNEEVKEKYKPKIIKCLSLNSEFIHEHSFRNLISSLEKKAFKQVEVLLAFKTLISKSQEAFVRKDELSKLVSAGVLNQLIKKNVIIEYAQEQNRVVDKSEGESVVKLSAAQNVAFSEIQNGFKEQKPVLLHGITGSGKTEIYIELINETIARGKQVLYLIPEIALTYQLINRLKKVFGKQVGVYHSKFNENERVEIWNEVLNYNDGQIDSPYQIVVGARSALFMPFKALGLIIIDEEHDYSFKQSSPAPRYHARDAAIYLSRLFDANVILGTATPSMESYYNARIDKYKYVQLKSKYFTSDETEIKICNIRKNEDELTMHGVLTKELYNAINQTLSNKRQIILFQNRRGFAPYTQCNFCGHVIYCKNCDVPLIYHKASNILSCHYCGHQSTPPNLCPACGSHDIKLKGLGTEKIEEDLQLVFTKAKIARMDLDSTRSKLKYKQIIDDFENKQIDILIGTQMVTKGLDFQNVDVVGIINVDSLLNFPDFRSFERAYQLIVQLKGRAGRKDGNGIIYIQTNQPEHSVLKCLKDYSEKDFYDLVLNERKQYSYPPFNRLIEITVQSKNVDELNFLSNELAKALREIKTNEILGPEYPMIPKLRNNFLKKILIKTDKSENVSKLKLAISNCIIDLHIQNKKSVFKIIVNVDPY